MCATQKVIQHRKYIFFLQVCSLFCQISQTGSMWRRQSWCTPSLSLQCTQSVTASAGIYLWQINLELWWRTLASTWLVACLAHLCTTNWPICQSSGLMIFMCLGLCIVYHYSSSNPWSCLSFNIIISVSLSLSEGCLPPSPSPAPS